MYISYILLIFRTDSVSIPSAMVFYGANKLLNRSKSIATIQKFTTNHVDDSETNGVDNKCHIYASYINIHMQRLDHVVIICQVISDSDKHPTIPFGSILWIDIEKIFPSKTIGSKKIVIELGNIVLHLCRLDINEISCVLQNINNPIK